MPKHPDIVQISSAKFLGGCALAALLTLASGPSHPLPGWAIAVQVLAAILALFVFGSIRYRIHKNALTYGAGMVVAATFFGRWWPQSALRHSFKEEGGAALWDFARRHLLTLHGLDRLFHADTMLFILGLTFFVAVIAQTRLLESVSFKLLNRNRGWVVPTVAMITGLVSVASGILDGVSMIGLMIRTMVIILFLAKAENEGVLYAVMVSTVVTTVCGMWLAYGEPPNLIMKANLHPYLDDRFFLRYCLPVAFGSYLIVLFNLKRRLAGKRVSTDELDVLDLNTADVRFLQAQRHGEVLTPIEFVEDHAALLADKLEPVIRRLHEGEAMGLALVREQVPEAARRELLGKFVSEDLAETLDRHYADAALSHNPNADAYAQEIRSILETVSRQRWNSQIVGIVSFVPFVALLVAHALNHAIPLFWASSAGFAVAVLGILRIPKMRALAFKEARHEYAEYLFLLPLFLSITLLQKTGFFDQISVMLGLGVAKLGIANVAYAQFAGATVLSAILDNNVVADFTSRALHGLDLNALHLFSMAQIAGYAAGGCWTHIGSAQSVVAYAFIQKEVDDRFTPFQWVKEMTPILLQIFAFMSLVVYGESFLFRYFGLE